MVIRSSLHLRAIACSFALLLPFLAKAETDGYSTVPTLKKALELAKEDGRLVFVELMAWNCHHCQAFEKKVLDSEEFQDYAADSLHLVIYDIKRQNQMTEEQRGEIAELIKKHRVRFTPTILVLSPGGELLQPPSVGYKGTPPEKIVEKLQDLAGKARGNPSGSDGQ